MELEDGIQKEKSLEQLEANDVEFRKELIRRNGEDPYIRYWLEESETRREYHAQIASWLEELKESRKKIGCGPDLEHDSIFGYRIKDLIILAERMKKEDITPEDLKNSTANFEAGFFASRRELEKQIEEQTKKMFKDMIDAASPEEKKEENKNDEMD